MLAHTTEYEYVGGEAHATLVAGLSASPSGTVHSVGFDDRLREIDGSSYAFAYPLLCVIFEKGVLIIRDRPASFSTAAQPKAGVAVG